MIMFWPCKVCNQPATSPEGCLLHAPATEQTFEEQLMESLMMPVAKPVCAHHEKTTDSPVL